jgi:DNA replication protein DnaC
MAVADDEPIIAIPKRRGLPDGLHPVSEPMIAYKPGYANPEDVPPCPECRAKVGARVMPALAALHPSFATRYFPADCVPCKSARELLVARRARQQRAEAQQLDVLRSVHWNPIPDRFGVADLAGTHVDANNARAHRACAALVTAMTAEPSGKRVQGFGLYGDRGVGKSHLSYATVRTLRAIGIPAVIFTLPDLDLVLGDLYGDRVRQRELRELLIRAPLLVIDDLGKERKTAEDNVLGEFFAHVIDKRWLATLPVMVTTNFDPIDLEAKRYAGMDRFQAGLDRLRDIFGSNWIPVAGTSRRG